jgi:virulence-associated protein VagC
MVKSMSSAGHFAEDFSMRATISEHGVTVPKEFFSSVGEVEICRENGNVVLRPVDATDPLLRLGSSPVVCGRKDASENHDKYLMSDEQ